MQIFRKSSFTPVPWKNGGGITNEALRVPLGADSYRWRVSVAEIGISGPFSSFADYHRTMVLLAGGGVRLCFADGAEACLRKPGDVLQFDGAVATQCELLAGACTDLNLIVSKAMPMPVARIISLGGPRSIGSDGSQTTVLFAVRGSFSIAGAGSAAVETWDLVVFAPGDQGILTPGAEDDPHAPLVFYATLDDNC